MREPITKGENWIYVSESEVWINTDKISAIEPERIHVDGRSYKILKSTYQELTGTKLKQEETVDSIKSYARRDIE